MSNNYNYSIGCAERRFKNAISDCLAQTHDTHKEELDSLLTLKFQSFKEVKKVQIVTA